MKYGLPFLELLLMMEDARGRVAVYAKHEMALQAMAMGKGCLRL